jgi:Flp pilus assembly protein TadD
MKKTINLIAAIIFTISFATAQTIADAVKNLNYGKNKTAKEQLQKMYAANDKDASTIYWLGQSMIAVDDVKGAKALYQKSLQAGVNEALLYVAMAHVNLLEGGDWNAANQKFESAITTSAETRGKNKGKAPVSILNAIGRANCIGHIADGSSKFGNPEYAVDKLTLASMIDATNTECLIYKGLCYRKMGGEFGGEAQKAYTEALSRNPNLPQANYLIGKIYLSQQNKPFMEQYFNAALANDITYAPVYLDYYNYYSNRDVSVAKGYIEKYIQYADKDCNNDYFYADYLFRAGNYQSSLDKAKELENSDCKMRVPVLYAYNYDRTNDSTQAKSSIEKFFATATSDKILASDYDIAAKIYARFPGSELQAVNALNKLIEFDNSKTTQLQYLPAIADLYAKAKNYQEQIKTIQKLAEVRGITSELDYYKMSVAAQSAKDYAQGLDIAKKYLASFPDKSQPVTFYRKSAIGLDPDSTKGIAIEPLTELNTILEKDVEKNRKSIFSNLYYMFLHYGDKVKNYPKTVEVLDKMLVLYPTAGEENQFASDQKTMIQKAMANPPKMPKTPTTPATPSKETKPAGTSKSAKVEKSKKK